MNQQEKWPSDRYLLQDAMRHFALWSILFLMGGIAGKLVIGGSQINLPFEYSLPSSVIPALSAGQRFRGSAKRFFNYSEMLSLIPITIGICVCCHFGALTFSLFQEYGLEAIKQIEFPSYGSIIFNDALPVVTILGPPAKWWIYWCSLRRSSNGNSVKNRDS
jgi:hypothetical protein